jgi:hypothetical protein
MLLLARAMDPSARAVRARYENLVVGVEREAYANLSKALFRIRGTSVYPDATFTLRLAYGVVKGYEEGGARIAPFTTIGGAFEKHRKHDGTEPYRLPDRWIDARERLDLSTRYNFVSTADIIGGNSGSPVVDRQGAVVGLIFDGNIQSLVLDYTYTETQARAVSVAAEAILEALEKVYGATALAEEIRGTRNF